MDSKRNIHLNKANFTIHSKLDLKGKKLLPALNIFLSLIILVFSLKEDGLGSHFATNPNNQYGKEKTITIDGTSSGWELDMYVTCFMGCLWMSQG